MAAPCKRVVNAVYLIQHGAHVVIANATNHIAHYVKNSVIHKTGSTRHIEVSSEDNNVTATINAYRKFCEVYSLRIVFQMLAVRHTHTLTALLRTRQQAELTIWPTYTY